MRTGLWMSGAGGSGVLLGRTEDGSWSPPSGILLHTAGLGFLVGVDIYDCVVVINTQKALDAFSKLRCTLGGEISAVAGPVGAGGLLETEIHKRQAPIFTYLKSRGFYAGVQVDGTIVVERADENERFYLQRIPCADILAGKVRHPPYELKTLFETLKAAEGDKNVNASLLPSEPPPGDYEVTEESDGPIFGIPDKEDPDPFGVKALQEAGLEIREATTRARASADDFEFRPSPTSPAYPAFNRRSMDSRSNHSLSRRSSWRTSTLSTEHRTPTIDSATQTEPGDDSPKPSSPKRSPHRDSRQPSLSNVPEHQPNDALSSTPPAIVTNGIDVPKPASPKRSPHRDSRQSSLRNVPEEQQPTDALPSPPPAIITNGIDTPDEPDEEPVVHEVQRAASPQALSKPQVVSKARLVTVQKRAPPALPPRNPGRGARKGPLVINAEASGSPTRDTATATSSPVSSMNEPQSALSRPSVEWLEASEGGRRSADDYPRDVESKDSRVDSANGEVDVVAGAEKEKEGEKPVDDAVREKMVPKRRESPTMPGAFDDDVHGEKEDFS